MVRVRWAPASASVPDLQGCLRQPAQSVSGWSSSFCAWTAHPPSPCSCQPVSTRNTLHAQATNVSLHLHMPSPVTVPGGCQLAIRCMAASQASSQMLHSLTTQVIVTHSRKLHLAHSTDREAEWRSRGACRL